MLPLSPASLQGYTAIISGYKQQLKGGKGGYRQQLHANDSGANSTALEMMSQLRQYTSQAKVITSSSPCMHVFILTL